MYCEPKTYPLAQLSSACGQSKICVFRALQLGDMLCAVPALRALRAAAPQAHITLLGLPWARSFVRRFSHYVDEHLAFPGFPGWSEQAPQLHLIPNFISVVQQRRFDLVLQMHGNGAISNPMTMLFDAACYAGFYRLGEYCPDPQLFFPWNEAQHDVLRTLNFMEFLGIGAQGSALEFPLFERDFRALQRCPINLPLPGTYVCILPGAGAPSGRWLPHRFAEVADRLSETGLRIVLSGSEKDTALARAVMREMRRPCLDLTGQIHLGACAALISQARMVICNDTGIAHIAAGVDTPSVIVSCNAQPHRWTPLNGRRHRVVRAKAAPHPHGSCVPPEEHHAAENITTEAVLSAANRVLADNLACMD